MDVNIRNGNDGKIASVSSTNRLNVSAKTNPRIFYTSRDNGLAFNAIATSATNSAGEFVMTMKNTSTTRNLFMKHIEFHSTNDVVWQIFEVTGTGVGTAIVPSNLNLGSGLSAEVDCVGSGAVTGLTEVKQIGTHRSQAGGDSEMNYENALILTPNSQIAIKYLSGTAGANEIDMFFHYEDIGAR